MASLIALAKPADGRRLSDANGWQEAPCYGATVQVLNLNVKGCTPVSKPVVSIPIARRIGPY